LEKLVDETTTEVMDCFQLSKKTASFVCAHILDIVNQFS